MDCKVDSYMNVRGNFSILVCILTSSRYLITEFSDRVGFHPLKFEIISIPTIGSWDSIVTAFLRVEPNSSL